MKQTGTIIVTGSTGGLGSAVARSALKQGFSVALMARSEKKLEGLKSEFPNGANVSTHAVDLTDAPATREVIAKIAMSHPAVRGLVHCAGKWMGSSLASSLDAGQVRESLDHNFFSGFHVTQALLSAIGLPAKSDLAIVHVGATASLDAWPEVLPFCLGKGALRLYSRALARELGPQGIHVAHLVIDGMLDTERTRNLNPSENPNRFLNTDAVAESIMSTILQPHSSWTFEWDLRPYNESW